MAARLLVVFVVLAALVGCSSSDAPTASAVERICTRLVYCGDKDASGAPLTQLSCEISFTAWLPPGACAPAYESSTCADVIASPVPADLRAACFPACAETTCSADGRTLNVCGSTGLVAFDCAKYCEADGKQFSGICGKTYNGKTSSTGKPVCWCS